MHGNGFRRKCHCGGLDPTCCECRELRGPRNITSSNIDRSFDDFGKRFLIIEHKRPGESMEHGQESHLRGYAKLQSHTVWVTFGTPDQLIIQDWSGNGYNADIEGDWNTLQAQVDAWYAQNQRLRAV